MASITFVQPDGTRRTVQVADGLTVMEGARANDIAGIEAQCGGQCSCSTCHCYVAPGWLARLPAVREPEKGLLEFAWEPRDNSRLTCQLKVGPELDGLELHVPAQQL